MDIDREKEGKCLTVTVPCYNSESYLERCVESLLKERDGLEIILVDDGSTDRTGQLADQYARVYPDVVRVVHKKNGGHGSGVNAGLMLANGIYFKVVDSDDWLDEAAFHKLMSVLRFWCRTKEENAQTWLSATMYTIIWKREKRKQSATEIFFPSKKSAGGTKSAAFRRNSILSCMR